MRGQKRVREGKVKEALCSGESCSGVIQGGVYGRGCQSQKLRILPCTLCLLTAMWVGREKEGGGEKGERKVRRHTAASSFIASIQPSTAPCVSYKRPSRPPQQDLRSTGCFYVGLTFCTETQRRLRHCVKAVHQLW